MEIISIKVSFMGSFAPWFPTFCLKWELGGEVRKKVVSRLVTINYWLSFSKMCQVTYKQVRPPEPCVVKPS